MLVFGRRERAVRSEAGLTAARRERWSKLATDEEGGPGQMMMIRAGDERERILCTPKRGIRTQLFPTPSVTGVPSW